MSYTTASFQTSDGLTIHTEAWLPDGDPKAVALIVHGYAEHIRRYAHVPDLLVRHGYAVYGLDHRGHGRSGGLRVHFDSFDQPVDDLKTYFDQVRLAQPDKRIFIYGHSMGSFIATQFVLRYQDELAGFISSGSPLTVDTTVPRLMVIVGNLLNSLAPNLPLIKLDLNAISRDPAVVAAYNSDPLVYQSPVRVRVAVSYNQALSGVRANLSQIRLPLLIVHGGADRLCPPSGSELMFREAASADKTLKIYPGLYHEVHNEPEKDTVLADLVAWLDGHSESSA